MTHPSQHTALFLAIYDDTYDKLFHFIHRLTARNDALTDDLVQNVYIALWEKIDTLNAGDNYLPLLYTIAKRQLIDHHRKTLSEQAKMAGWLERQSGSSYITADVIALKEIHREMEKVLSVMPERRKEIFLLCREEGLSHREIARRLNINIHTVEQQMNLALKAFQKKVQAFSI